MRAPPAVLTSALPEPFTEAERRLIAADLAEAAARWLAERSR